MKRYILFFFTTIAVLSIDAVRTNVGGLNYTLIKESHEAIISYGNKCVGEVDIPSEVNYNDETFVVTSMIWKAFYDSPELTKVRIPKTLESVMHYYPNDPDEGDIETILVSSDVMNPFSRCYSLESIEVDEENPSMKSVDGVLISKDGTRLYCYPIGKQQEAYSIPEDVEWIGANAFEGSYNLTTLTIPNSITHIYSCAFQNCNNLTDVYCYADNVPITWDYAFKDTPIASATLHVPAGSVEKYKATSPWSGFGNIVAIEEPYQPLPLLEGNPIWVYKYEHIPMPRVPDLKCWIDTGEHVYTYFFLGGKKEIEGRAYTMMGEVRCNRDGKITLNRWLPVREENGIVYAITDSLPGVVETEDNYDARYNDDNPMPYLRQGNECVLYNFSTSIGETLYPQNEGSRVKSIDTYQLLDGTECRVLKTQWAFYDLYEKLGLLNADPDFGIMDPFIGWPVSLNGHIYLNILNAYYQDNIMLYKAPDARDGLCVNDTCWTRDDAEAYARSYKADPHQEEVFSYIRQLQKASNYNDETAEEYFPEGTKWTEIRLDTLKYDSWYSKVGDKCVPNFETIKYHVEGEYIDESAYNKYSCVYTNSPEWTDSLTLLIYKWEVDGQAYWHGGVTVAAFDDDGQLSWPFHGQMYPLSFEVGTQMSSLNILIAGATGGGWPWEWDEYGTVEEIKEGDFGGVRPLKYSDVNGIRFIQGIGVASWNDGECIFGPIRPYEVLSALGAVEDEQRHYRSMLVHFERDGEVLYDVWPEKPAISKPVTFTQGQIATIILPTEPDASKGKYYRLDRYEDGQIIFEQELQPQAHIPYIIVPNEDFSIDLSTLDLAGLSRDTVSIAGISFIGSFTSEEFNYEEGAYIDIIDKTPDCRFGESCVIGALRAYLLVRWDDPYNQGGTRIPPLNKRGIVLRDYETGITSPLGETGEATLYDLQGRMLPSKPAQGIYIKNRQKVMVK